MEVVILLAAGAVVMAILFPAFCRKAVIDIAAIAFGFWCLGKLLNRYGSDYIWPYLLAMAAAAIVGLVLEKMLLPKEVKSPASNS